MKLDKKQLQALKELQDKLVITTKEDLEVCDHCGERCFDGEGCDGYNSEESSFMCNSCGGGFAREEIKTDEWGDDYCLDCK